MQGGGVRADLGAEAQVLALGHDRHPVVAQGAAEQDGIAGLGPVAGDVDARGDHPQAGGGDEEAVRLAPLHHLGVAGHHRDAGLVGRPRHAFHHPGQVGQGKAFLQDETRRQVEGAGAGHGHIVDGAMHRQAANVAAGEEEGGDDVAVGAHHQAPRRGLEQGLVVALAQQFVVQVALEQFGDELGHGASTAAMAHVHRPALEVEAWGESAWLVRHDVAVVVQGWSEWVGWLVELVGRARDQRARGG